MQNATKRIELLWLHIVVSFRCWLGKKGECTIRSQPSLVRIRQYKHTNQCTDHQFTIKSLQSNGVNGQTVLIVPPTARSYTRSTIECDLSIGENRQACKQASKQTKLIQLIYLFSVYVRHGGGVCRQYRRESIFGFPLSPPWFCRHPLKVNTLPQWAMPENDWLGPIETITLWPLLIERGQPSIRIQSNGSIENVIAGRGPDRVACITSILIATYSTAAL